MSNVAFLPSTSLNDNNITPEYIHASYKCISEHFVNSSELDNIMYKKLPIHTCDQIKTNVIRDDDTYQKLRKVLEHNGLPPFLYDQSSIVRKRTFRLLRMNVRSYM